MPEDVTPTPSDQEHAGQPVPETQPDHDVPDRTPQGRTDEKADEQGSAQPDDA